MHHGGLFRLWREFPHPAPDKQACLSSGGVCEADSTNEVRRATCIKLRKYDARCCIIFTEGYRSGHNEAVLKTRAQTFLLFPQNPCHIKGFRHCPSYKNFIVLSRNSLQIPEHFAKDNLRRVIEVVITRRS